MRPPHSGGCATAERGHEHDERDGGGTGVVVLLQARDDEQGRDFGTHRHVAGDEDHRAVLAERAREGHRESGEQGRAQQRKHDAAECQPAVCAEAGGRFLHLRVHVFEHWLDAAHNERQTDKHERDEDADGREGHADSDLDEPSADPAVLGIETGEGDAGHRRGQRERQIDERVHQPLARKAVAHQNPGDHQPEGHIHRRRGERCAEAQLVGRDHARRADRFPEVRPTGGRRFQEHGAQGHQHDQAQVEDGVAERRPEAG
jgi:hypothetical protein